MIHYPRTDASLGADKESGKQNFWGLFDKNVAAAEVWG